MRSLDSTLFKNVVREVHWLSHRMRSKLFGFTASAAEETASPRVRTRELRRQTVVGGAANVLVIDDDLEVRSFIERVLSQAGYCVRSAATARQSANEMQDRSFQAVVMDASLPDVDMLEFIQDTRRQFPWLKILVCSGSIAGPMEKIFLGAGAHTAIRKPVSPTQLRFAVYEALYST